MLSNLNSILQIKTTWWLVIYSFNYTLMRSKVWFIPHFYFIILIFLFFDAINITYSHDVKDQLNSIGKDASSDYILCRQCGADLADANDIINRLSPQAVVVTNQTLFEKKEVEIQLLKNPLGIKFDSIALSHSRCFPVHYLQKNFSWYPGYAWRPCICKQCLVHLGWFFEPVETLIFDLYLPTNNRFFILKLDSLLSKNFADSLIVIPKSYKN